ncbi:MAG: exopolysaccharide biosynthesis polyprenyl glycosylphosphotransferase [Acidimicrobiales bacterium]
MLVVLGVWFVVFNELGVHHGTLRSQLVPVGAVTAVAVVILAFKQLYLSRVCRVRVIEVSLLARAALATALFVHLAESPLALDLSVQRSLAAAGLMWAGLSVSRGLFGTWLRRRRSQGHHTRPMVVVGRTEEAAALARLIEDNPGYGFRAAGVIAPDVDILAVLEEQGSDSVLLVSGTLGAEEQRRLVKRLQDALVHVHYSSGFRGIDHRRLRPQPIAREPIFYIERLTVSPWQVVAKRVVDIVGSVIGLVLSAPLMLLAALAIRMDDGGPIVFRQDRVGLGGLPFRIFKLRTMVLGADRMLHLVIADNERVGPLYKNRNDRRTTRVGRWLRATSLDEVPQLLNVLLGSMSLVGPRPALAHEVEQFDLELQDRTRVKPGMTGLWQTEARDSASLEPYRQHDLFYVDNWSLELDFVILLATVKAVVTKAAADLRHRATGDTKVIEMTTTSLGADVELAVIDLTASPSEPDQVAQ